MAVNVDKVIGAGLDRVFYGVVDSSGYLIGNTATAPVAGNQAGSAMAQLIKAKSFPFAPVDPDRPTATGDDGAAARFIFNPVDLPETNFTFAAGDLNFEALCQTFVVQDIGGYSFLGVQSGDGATYADLCFLVTSQAKSQDSGSVGASHWENLLILKANVFPRGRISFEERAVASYEYAMVANYAAAHVTGLGFTSVLNGGTQFAALRFTSTYRPIFQRWTGDNSQVEFNLAKNIAEDSANNIAVYVNGAAATWVTGVPGAGEFGITEGTTDVLKLGTAPGTDAKVVALYGYLP